MITHLHKFLVSVSTFAIFQTDLTKNTCKKKGKGKRNHAGSLSCKSCNRMTYDNRQI